MRPGTPTVVAAPVLQQANLEYNLFGLQETIVRAEEAVPVGEHQVRMEFAYDGGGLGKGGTVTHYLDGNPLGDTMFTGTIKWIELESGDDTHDHLIDPAQFLHFVVAKQ